MHARVNFCFQSMQSPCQAIWNQCKDFGSIWTLNLVFFLEPLLLKFFLVPHVQSPGPGWLLFVTDWFFHFQCVLGETQKCGQGYLGCDPVGIGGHWPTLKNEQAISLYIAHIAHWCNTFSCECISHFGRFFATPFAHDTNGHNIFSGITDIQTLYKSSP